MLENIRYQIKNVWSYRPRGWYTTEVYQPELIKTYQLSLALPIPCYELRTDKIWSGETERMDAIVQILQANNIFRDDLLYCGIKGWPVIKAGSFGKRTKTYALTNQAIRRSIYPSWRNRHYINTPFMHMDAIGGRLPAVAVFSPEGFRSGGFFYEESDSIPDYDRIAWWTRNGSTLDSHCLALFIFKHYNAQPHELTTVRRKR